MPLASSEIEKIVAPISAEQPAGVLARYEPEYEAVETEIGKQESLTPQSVDWAQVVAHTAAILGNKSKDFTMAVYLMYGLYSSDRYAGLADGLQIYDALLNNYWENGYPELKRLRGRIAPLGWFTEKLEKDLNDKKPTTSERESVKTCAERARALVATFSERLKDQAPDFGRIAALLERYALDLAKDDKPPETKLAAVAGDKPNTAAVVEVTSDSDIPKALKQCQDILKQVAAYLRDKRAEDPRSYRLTRVAAWLAIEQLPPNENGVTQIPAVSAEVRAKYDNYYTGGEYAALVREVEAQLLRTPFWLDGQRLVAAALDAQGPKFQRARAVVETELRAFLQRLPRVEALKFFDESPFADDKTRLWLESAVQTQTAVKSEGVTGATTTPAEHPWNVALTDARKLAATGKIKEALELFRGGIQQAGTQRGEFCWRLAQARFCYESGFVDTALPQLEYLDQQVQQASLERWEPELGIEITRLLLQVYDKVVEKKKKAGNAAKTRIEALYARMCLLDTKTALELFDKPGLKKTITTESE